MKRLRAAFRWFPLALVVYLALLVVTRPLHRHWGSIATERTEALPGDEHSAARGRSGDRAIAIRAAAEDVWPWLLQMGEDRGGFYSYSVLENLCGLHVVNASRIVPEWQRLAPGDFVRAVPPDWLGGVFGRRIGWEVDHVDAARHVLALRYWIFEVESTSANTSRLHVRTSAGDAPVPVAPILFLAFEPIHFVMERAMLIGIKQRAEELSASGSRLRRRS